MCLGAILVLFLKKEKTAPWVETNFRNSTIFMECFLKIVLKFTTVSVFVFFLCLLKKNVLIPPITILLM